jgi:hypothetical protein
VDAGSRPVRGDEHHGSRLAIAVSLVPKALLILRRRALTWNEFSRSAIGPGEVVTSDCRRTLRR